jgi:hypothetical protein
MNDIRLSAIAFLLACSVLMSVLAQTGPANKTPPVAPVANPAAVPDPSVSDPSRNSNLIDAQDNAAQGSASAPSPSTNGNLPIGPRNPQTPPVVDAAPKADAPGAVIANISAEQTFATLDRSHKGYLETKDVASNKYLAGHFQECDANHDGRLDRDEVSSCLKQVPPSKQ